MNTPRILFISHTGTLGGAELSMIDIAVQFRDTATFVLFEDGPFRKRLQDRDIAVQVLPAASSMMSVQRDSGAFGVVRAIPETIRLVTRIARLAGDYDLIYAASQKALIVGSLAGLLVNRSVVWHLHDILSADHFSAFTRCVSVQLANYLVERVFVNSEASREAFVASGGDGDNTHVVYYGIDAEPFDRVNGSAIEAVRRELSLPDAPLVGVFSRLAEWKGQDVLIRALPALPDVHALLVGDALFQDDVQYKKRLEALTAELGVGDRVHFLGFRDDIPRLMKAVDIVLHTSTAPEPFGRVIVEGMLAQRPVIATRAGGAEEIIDHNNTGLLVPPGSASATASAIRYLIERPERAQTITEKGYQSAKSRFSVPKMRRKVSSCIAVVCE
jgi:glycosyltransferase involved in cell wall biosynthesis